MNLTPWSQENNKETELQNVVDGSLITLGFEVHVGKFWPAGDDVEPTYVKKTDSSYGK